MIELSHKIELVSGLLRFSLPLLILDFVLILHFVLSWYYTKKKTGWVIDYWYFTLFLLFFIPVLLMYPFNASFMNIISVGNNYYKLEKYIDKAFLITLVGYVNLWIGRYIYDTIKLKTLFSILYIFILPIEKIIYSNLRKKATVIILSNITIIMILFVILIQIKYGYLFNPRKFFLENDILRPLYNATISLYPVSLLYIFLFYLKGKKLSFKLLLYILIIFGIFLGTRGAIVGSLVTLYLFYIFNKNGKENLIKIFLVGFFALFLALYIDSLRHGQYNVFNALSIGLIKIFYGNNFSDTRDFAWILTYLDGEYFLGKTYLAGLVSFIPRFILDFRSEWAISVVTDRIVGFSPSEHAGLRPGMFGEAYFNFGILGVMILGLIAGYFLRYVDLQIKKSIVLHRDIIKGYSKTVIYGFVSKFFITAGFWSFYVFVFINFLLFFLNAILSNRRKK
jgi:oligosaccharide repeat unit polymerase